MVDSARVSAVDRCFTIAESTSSPDEVVASTEGRPTWTDRISIPVLIVHPPLRDA